MTIKQIIVHKLDRTPEADSLQTISADHSLETSPSLELVLDDLLQTYNKKQDKCYGQFLILQKTVFRAC